MLQTLRKPIQFTFNGQESKDYQQKMKILMDIEKISSIIATKFEDECQKMLSKNFYPVPTQSVNYFQ
jgi:hypothetical protein